MPKKPQTKPKFRLISNYFGDEKIIGDFPTLGEISRVLNTSYNTVQKIQKGKCFKFPYLKIINLKKIE